MRESKDLEKTILENIESELDKTLDAKFATDSEVEATIKIPSKNYSQTLPNITLTDNEDASQTITIQKQSFSYEQQTVFDDSLDKTIAQDEIEKTVVMPMVDNENTIEMPSVDIDKTIVEMDVDKTIVEVDTDKTIAMPTMDDDKTIVDNSAKQGTAEATGSQNIFASGESTSRSGSSVSFSGGSISVNVRPRNVSATLGGSAGVGDEQGLNGSSFSDFELISKLGEGGMGVVYSARQSSIDRSIALKMIKSDVVTEEAKSKFLVEAVVTGDLDHPNIVPVHDLGVDSSGNIFYAMKQVAGVEWSSAIGDKSKSENIEILLRVCDAIAFAHDRGVIHRDLKPENVMLGAFGEVLVMDWGLSLAVNDTAKAECVGPNTGIAGTPAYLAPEMARAGSWRMLGFCSDIYLLGAILFEIITGKRPHTGKSVRQCLLNAAQNIIREVENTGELIDIAYKAMATNPADRYPSVKDFQKAIREYMSHSESITLSDKAEGDLVVAEKSGVYDDYAKALFGFRQAVELWSGNSAAKKGEINAGVEYAVVALSKGDLDLGLSLVTDAEEFAEIKRKLLVAKDDREKHQRRLKRLTRGVAVLGVVILVISVVAAIWIYAERAQAIMQREEAVKQEAIAIEQREEAKRQEAIAVEQREEAKRQGAIAVAQREEARKQTLIAEEQRKEAVKQEKIANERKLLAQAETKRANEQMQIAEEQRKEAKRQAEIAREQEKIANEKKLLAMSESKRANEQMKIAEEQRKIAMEKKALAEAETKRANEQTAIATKAKAVAEKEKENAQKSEEKALQAINKMVTAQTQEQMEKAKREAAELTAKETQEELSARDELKKNEWWIFDSEEAKKMQEKASEKYNLPLDEVITVGGVPIDFKLIPAGKFGMGSKLDEVGRSSEEYLHRVEISKPFYISVTELTMKQWVALTGEKESGEGNYPVWNISYNDLQTKILPAIKAQLPQGWDVKVPTEAQWEWAGRAGTNTAYYSGSSKEGLPEIGYTGIELLTSAKEVAQLEPNAWGLYDMIGNLAEWCEDTYVRNSYLTGGKLAVDPVVTTGGKHNVVRGGAWSNLPEHCRVGYRSYANKKSQYNFLGVRLVLVPPTE